MSDVFIPPEPTGQPDDTPHDDIRMDIDDDDDTSDATDDTNADDTDDTANTELREAIGRAETTYRKETDRLGQLIAALDGLVPGLCQPIPADAREASQIGITDDIAFARERTIKCLFHAISGIANRSDVLKQAERVLALSCDSRPREDKGSHASHPKNA